VQLILPLDNALKDKLRRNESLIDQENSTEVSWPGITTLTRSWAPGTFQMEPHESDEVDFDFILDATIETVAVYTYFDNTSKAGRNRAYADGAERASTQNHGIGWSWTTIYQISSGEPNDDDTSVGGRGQDEQA
jgi:hypothetical protein